MVQFNLSDREIVLKLVYYGPALSGKTTNLQAIHEMVSPQARGRLMTLDTANDRTLFFDLLPLLVHTGSGVRFKVKLYTVPGQVMHASTRRLVLAGADGVAFVADSQRALARANREAWRGMVDNLKKNGLDPEEIPIVIQLNKCDLPDTHTEEEVEEMRRRSREPIFRASAIRKEGVLETLLALVRESYRYLDRKEGFERKFGVSERAFLRQVCAGVSDRERLHRAMAALAGGGQHGG